MPQTDDETTDDETTDYEAAVALFLRTKSITRCPTVCAVPTQAIVADDDRAAYRSYIAAKEAARLEKAGFPAALGSSLAIAADIRRSIGFEIGRCIGEAG